MAALDRTWLALLPDRLAAFMAFSYFSAALLTSVRFCSYISSNCAKLPLHPRELASQTTNSCSGACCTTLTGQICNTAGHICAHVDVRNVQASAAPQP